MPTPSSSHENIISTATAYRCGLLLTWRRTHKHTQIHTHIQEENKHLNRDGVSLQTLADIALRIQGMHVERLHAQGGTGGGYTEQQFREVRVRISCLHARA